MPRKKAVEEIYQKKSPREHVLLRPDTYVGSVQRDTEKMFVMDEEKELMVEEEIEYVPALYKIFDEILVNAADNKQRDSSMREIRVRIDIPNGSICIKNDGKGIPIEMHSEHNMYIPELIFGNLLTSSNYDDSDLKTVGGRNGFGAKLANIFSTKFVVETVDNENGKKYVQKWTSNMSNKSSPVITEVTSKRMKDYTKITFYPDFERFNMESFENEDILKLFIKRVYDIAGTTPSDLKVYLHVSDRNNNGQIQVKTFIEYAKLFIGKKAKSKADYFHNKINDNWEIILAISSDETHRQISHVNNIWTIKGGSHVKYIEGQFIKYFKDNFKDKQKKIKEMLKPQMIRNHLFIFINSLIINPSFSSQTKEVLTTKQTDFGSKAIIPDDIKKRLMNKIKTMVKEFLNYKLEQAAKKTDGGRRKKIKFPPEIEDANDAGKSKGLNMECTLIVTEGLSAKTLAVAGISELDGSNDRYGIFPLKGKLLNVREAPRSQINKNTEINNLKQILGLKHGMKYIDKKVVNKSLRYGKVMIMTDQDYDGSHIKGLMINLFHSEWPELIHNKIFGPNNDESFIEQFITPIVVASKNTIKKSFYTIPEYEKWRLQNNNGKGWKIKYYKGLGSWQRQDGKEHFKKLHKHRIAFNYTNRNDINIDGGNGGNENDAAIVKAFAKNQADSRKQWIAEYEEGTHVKYNESISYKQFIDKELILFSVNDLSRSVPSIYDGLKPGQRKILYCCFLKNLKKELRVAQLGGYVSEKSAYHHGEQSLYQTIIGMAQDYIGSNNINLLIPNGMFGSRIKGGKDAASPRYIHTKLSAITRQLFHIDDDMILEYQDDDGYPVEPKYYVPIIPTILINGCKGIGTGWSTFIPNYNPNDIIKNIRRKLSGEDWNIMHPFYRGFKGEIICQNASSYSNTDEPLCYKTKGIIEIIDTFSNDAGATNWSTIQITELPIGQWTENYKKYLMDLEETEQIENVNNMSSDIDISFKFDIMHKNKPIRSGGRNNNNSRTNSNSNSNSPDRGDRKKIKKKIYFSGELDETFLKDLKLISSMSCTNMVLFDCENKIKKYKRCSEILEEFYNGRLKAYSLRKKAMLASLEHLLSKITNQARFIMMIIHEELILKNRKRKDILKDLKRLKFDLWEALKSNDTNTLQNRANQTNATFNENDNNENENENKMDVDSNNNDIDDDYNGLNKGYSYLLSMSLSSLTKENVEQLLKNKNNTQEKVNILKQKTVKDLWRYDLNELENYLNQYENNYQENISKMRIDAQKKRNKNKNKNIKKKQTKKRKYTKKKTTKTKTKTKESSISSNTTTSSINKSIKKLTTKKIIKKKGKKKLLSTSNSLPSDPFSIAKKNSKKNNKKQKQKKEESLSDISDDDEFEQSPNQHLSLFERCKKKRNTPEYKQKNNRKRKRQLTDDDDDDDSSDEQFENEPPKKRRNMIQSLSKSKSSSTDTLKSITNKKNKNKNNNIMELDGTDESDDYESDYGKQLKTNKKNKSKNKFLDSDSDSDDDDDDFDINNDSENNNNNKNQRVLRKKNNRKSYKEKTNSLSYGGGANNDESEYNNSESDDLQIDENDSDSDFRPYE